MVVVPHSVTLVAGEPWGHFGGCQQRGATRSSLCAVCSPPGLNPVPTCPCDGERIPHPKIAVCLLSPMENACKALGGGGHSEAGVAPAAPASTHWGGVTRNTPYGLLPQPLVGAFGPTPAVSPTYQACAHLQAQGRGTKTPHGSEGILGGGVDLGCQRGNRGLSGWGVGAGSTGETGSVGTGGV